MRCDYIYESNGNSGSSHGEEREMVETIPEIGTPGVRLPTSSNPPQPINIPDGGSEPPLSLKWTSIIK